VFESRCSTDRKGFSFSSYDWRNLLTDSATEIRFWWKKAINLKAQLQVNEWLNLLLWPIPLHFVLNLSVSQLPNIPLNPKSLQQFIALFTWPQSQTVAFSQYTAFQKHNILYFPVKSAGLLVNLIKFPYAVLIDMLWTSTYHFIVGFVHNFLPYISNYVAGNKLWRYSN
jgi:hypothetical protein